MKKWMAMFVFLTLTLIPESCLRQPPNVEEVESFMDKNWESIVLVNDYLLGLGDRDAIIDCEEGDILIDLVLQQIEDDAVREAIQSLRREGCTGISKTINTDDIKNAIDYLIWIRTIGGVSCGFVYAIDHTRPPKLQYQTELIPLSREGWYYYIENYEEWRENNRHSR